MEDQDDDDVWKLTLKDPECSGCLSNQTEALSYRFWQKICFYPLEKVRITFEE